LSPAWFEESFGERYLRLYAHRDRTEAATALATLFPEHSLAGRRALDLACGPGRYLRVLHERGAYAVGLDLSGVLLREAREQFATQGVAAPLVRGDMRTLPFVDGSFDVTLCMFTSFGYFETVAAHQALAREIGRVTRAVIILDLPDHRSLARSLVPESERRLEDRRVFEHRQVLANPRRVVKQIEVSVPGGDQIQEHYEERVLLFDHDEIGKMFADAGFSIVDALGDYDGSNWVEGRSPRMLLRLQRRKHR
jgi:SAM-dependent methyltransferase